MLSQEKPKLSILIACYNEEKGLPACLDSVINQDFKDIEIIVVNDGSTDHSLEILEHYQRIDSRIRIITQKNGGIAKVRNILIKEAKGLYVSFVDADDFLEKGALSLLYNNTEKEKYDVVFGKSNVIFNQKYKTPFIVQRNNKSKIEKENFFKWNICVPWGWIMKTEIVKKSPEFLVGWVYEDLIINYFFLSAKDIKIIKNVVYNYCRYSYGNHISTFNKNKIWDVISIKKQITYLLLNLERTGKLRNPKIIESINSILVQPLWVLIFLKKYYGYNKKISNLILADIFSLISEYNLYFQISRMHWKLLSYFCFKLIFHNPKKTYKKNKPLKLKHRKIFVSDANLNFEKEKVPRNCYLYVNSNDEIAIKKFIQKHKKKIKIFFIHNEILTQEKRLYLLDFGQMLGLNVGFYYDDTSFDFDLTSNKIMAQDFSMISHNNFYEKIQNLIKDNRVLCVYSSSQFDKIKFEAKQLWNILVT